MIVLSPTDRWLKSALNDCKSTLAISSPYIGEHLHRAVSQLGEEISITLLTRTLLVDFASKASDLKALRALAERAGGILSLSSLHAKVYVIDSRRALITSANATHSGMYRNRECGYQLTNTSEIRALRRMLLAGFGSSPQPQLWTAQDLDELREPVEKFREALPRPIVLQSADIEAPRRVQRLLTFDKQLLGMATTYAGRSFADQKEYVLDG